MDYLVLLRLWSNGSLRRSIAAIARLGVNFLLFIHSLILALSLSLGSSRATSFLVSESSNHMGELGPSS